MWRIPIYLFFALILFVPVIGWCDDDWQVWLDQSVGQDISENFTLRVDQSFRMNDDVSSLGAYVIQVGLQQHTKPWIEHGYYLRYVRDRTGEDDLNELRPTYDLVLKWNWGKTRWANRNRFEYRIREARDDDFRYRNRTKLILPWKLTPLELKPYGAVELFGDDETSAHNNRVRGTLGIQTEADGFMRKLNSQTGNRYTTDVYWMYNRTEKNGTAVNDYVVGFKMGYFF
jgi:hypothetical protein